uniref:Uncharacterized protein n=1 Tax=Klebsiella pneumoniae TaxID=573 RepID=A0A6M6A027_KLEPN|nr:hypothetical protein [Klebsiella pneumoniae]
MNNKYGRTRIHFPLKKATPKQSERNYFYFNLKTHHLNK